MPAVRWLAAGCAEALESIHDAGLVHRDLKPSNVLVSPDGPRVIDFGVARAAERIQLTVTRGAVGTPAYMAPEQARDTRQASVASDMFSLGATLLFAATGHPPYPGDTVMDVLVRLATEPPDLDGLPPDLASMVTACLERSPAAPAHLGGAAGRAGAVRRQPGRAGAAHSYLTGPALALIDGYRHSPDGPLVPAGPPGGDEEESEDATVGSYSALPAARRNPAAGTATGAGRRAAGPGGVASWTTAASRPGPGAAAGSGPAPWPRWPAARPCCSPPGW